MKKVLFTAIALIAFSGLVAANNDLKTANYTEKLQLQFEENTKTNTSEEKDVWFCYKSSESSSYNSFSGETTVTTTYNCTWYSLAAE